MTRLARSALWSLCRYVRANPRHPSSSPSALPGKIEKTNRERALKMVASTSGARRHAVAGHTESAVLYRHCGGSWNIQNLRTSDSAASLARPAFYFTVAGSVSAQHQPGRPERLGGASTDA